MKVLLCWLGFHGKTMKEVYSYPSHRLNKIRRRVSRACYGRYECTACQRKWIEKGFI